MLDSSKNYIDCTESLKVTGKELAPQFTVKLEAREVLAYQEVILECNVIGFPEPEITWYQVRINAFLFLSSVATANFSN